MEFSHLCSHLWNSINHLWNSINAYFSALRLAIRGWRVAWVVEGTNAVTDPKPTIIQTNTLQKLSLIQPEYVTPTSLPTPRTSIAYISRTSIPKCRRCSVKTSFLTVVSAPTTTYQQKQYDSGFIIA